ncbi:M13 family metallopeptidase [Marinoscillum sp.]|uniref:M13 family metallopeptidase n=1 Tax=Marinoscillum sp. TaxID=2024838 RepID=UPI003BAA9E30
MKKTLLTTLSAAILFSACQPEKEETSAREMPPGLDMTMMNQEVSPKEDFYRFANGGWLDKTEIPADEGRWGGFPELREKNDGIMLNIMEQAAKNPEFKDGSDERKAIEFFSVGMDSTLAEKVGVVALDKWMNDINGVSNQDELEALIAKMHVNGYGPYYGVNAFADLMDSKVNALYVGAGGLGLPNRDYYTKTDAKSKEIREKYVAHIAKMLEKAKVNGDYEQMAQDVMEIENRLALASLTPIEARNIPALYNPMTVGGLQEMAPNINWERYLKTVGVDMSKVDTLIVTQPKFVNEVNAMLADTDLEKTKAYLKWNVVNQAANFLNNDMVQTNFDFYGKVIQGTDQMRPREERVLSTTNGVIGEAIGKVYVAETFPPEAKASAEEMVENLMKAFDQRIKNLPWMSDSSKQQALKKLNNLTVKIGYPDKWRDYSSLNVESSGESYSFLSNMENAWRWQFAENIKEVGEPVDKQRWGMNPQTVNAYFNPLNNEIVFPAAILQPPFYNYTADAAVNYGGMGAVIGHEISHGFDDQGSRFDWQGNMVNWWTEGDRERFNARTDKLVAQFDAYEALDSVNVQGKLTLGENIGDLGGLNAAYDALQIHLKENGNPGLIDGFTPEQRLFISWATIWRTKYKDEYLRTQVLTDPHSPGMFRAIGPLTNMETFYEAFDIQEGDELWRPEDERVKIW